MQEEKKGDYENNWGDNKKDVTNEVKNFYEETNFITSRVINQKTTQSSIRYDQNIRVDYTYPFNNNKAKLEIGYKRDYDKMNSDYLAEQLFPVSDWRKIPPSNKYNYYQDVNSLYSQLANQSGKFSYQVGLRFENTYFFADLMITAPTPSPIAQTNPRKFPKKSPASNAS